MQVRVTVRGDGRAVREGEVVARTCDRGESRDALGALEVRDAAPRIVETWRGNLRAALMSPGDGVVRALLELLGPAAAGATRVTIGIDTPLGWPRAMVELVTVDVPDKADWTCVHPVPGVLGPERGSGAVALNS